MSSSSDAPSTEKTTPQKIQHHVEGSGVKLSITISKAKPARKQVVIQSAKGQIYDLTQGYSFDERIRALTPQGTPEYVDHGEKYSGVPWGVRALILSSKLYP